MNEEIIGKVALQYGIPAAIAIFLVYNLNKNFGQLLSQLPVIIQQNSVVIKENAESNKVLTDRITSLEAEVKGLRDSIGKTHSAG